MNTEKSSIEMQGELFAEMTSDERKPAKKKASPGRSEKRLRKSASPATGESIESRGKPARSPARKGQSSAAATSNQHSDLSSGVLIITGEHSGDLLGADVARELKKQGVKKLFGTGGPEMRSAGVELLEDIETMNVVGFVEALKAYRRLKALAGRIVEFARKNGISHAILVDYPGFNLRLAEMLKRDSFFITYLVSPQLWAWHYSRIKTIRKYVDLMLPLFPFEEEMYRNEGITAHCVGHPLVHRIG